MKTKKSKLIEYNQGCILNAAKELFQKNGVLKTTVDEIALAADCSKATIYVYFKNKDDIYYNIVFEYMTMLRDNMKLCFSDTEDYENAYFSLCNILVQFEKEYPMYFEFVLGNISVDAKKMEELPILKSIFDVGEQLNEIVCAFLERAKKSGFIRADIDPLQTTFVMWSSICGWISLCSNKQTYLQNNLAMPHEDLLKKGFSMILQMITNGE